MKTTGVIRIGKPLVGALLLSASLLSSELVTAGPQRNKALLIGIDQYESDDWPTLSHAGPGVRLLKRSLERLGFSVHTLPDSRATRDAILDTLDRMTRRADQFLLFFAGYTDGRFLIPYDGSKDTDSYVACDELVGFTSRVKSRAVIIDGVARQRSRFAPREGHCFLRNSNYLVIKNTTNDYVAQGRPGTFFTRQLVQGIDGAADANRDRIVTLEELSSYLKRRLPAQGPTVSSRIDTTGAEFQFRRRTLVIEAPRTAVPLPKPKSEPRRKSEPKPGPITTDLKVQIPKFPWPPPSASATEVLPFEFFRSGGAVVYLKDVDRHIRSALDFAGYFGKSYYAVPDGFAMVTRLEQINDDGTPMEGKERWAVDIGPPRRFSLREYVEVLFTANPGYYRIVVFVVTPHPFSQDARKISRDESSAWLSGGLNKLPKSIGKRGYSEDHTCTVLIYEFEKSRRRETAKTKVPGRLPGRVHLIKAKLWATLAAPR